MTRLEIDLRRTSRNSPMSRRRRSIAMFSTHVVCRETALVAAALSVLCRTAWLFRRTREWKRPPLAVTTTRHVERTPFPRANGLLSLPRDSVCWPDVEAAECYLESLLGLDAKKMNSLCGRHGVCCQMWSITWIRMFSNVTAGLDNHPVLTCGPKAYQILHSLFVSPTGKLPSFDIAYHCPT